MLVRVYTCQNATLLETTCTVSFVFFNRHSTIMNLVKEKPGGPIPTGLKRPSIISPTLLVFREYSAGPAGCCHTRAFAALIHKERT